jgi:hypothetical protein
MNLDLREIEPDEFVRRALVPTKKQLSAIVVEESALEKTADHLSSLAAAHVPVTRVQLDAHLRSRSEAVAKQHPTGAVVISSDSDDSEMWRALDAHRARLNDRAATLLVLSERAAASLQRNAPHVVSLISGAIWQRRHSESPSTEQQHLNEAIERAARVRYVELYEDVTDRDSGDLEETISDVIDALGDPEADERAWRRAGFMTQAMLVEVLPTISAHWPAASGRGNTVLDRLDRWLALPMGASLPPQAVVRESPVAPQALAEAMDVVSNASRLQERRHVRQAAIEIVEACIEGYAIFPGSAGRRALFDWWLCVVIPAAWALKRPKRLSRDYL